MIKIRIGGSGQETILFGLSDRNIEELKKGRPIRVPGEALRMPTFTFVIFSKPTEREMLDEFVQRKMVPPDHVGPAYEAADRADRGELENGCSVCGRFGLLKDGKCADGCGSTF
jgi:hypothetical protein